MGISDKPYNCPQFYEEDLPTFQEKKKTKTRISPPVAYGGRPEGHGPAAEKGPKKAPPCLTPSTPPMKPQKGEILTLFSSESGPGQDAEWRIAVSRKIVRLATGRNRWRRRIREILRKLRQEIQPRHRLVWKLHRATPALGPAELEREIQGLLRRAGLWRSDKP